MSKTKITMTPDQITKAWQTGMTNSVQKIIAGVNAVTDNPMSKAIAAIPKMQQNFDAAVSSGKIARGMGRVTLQQWKSVTAAKDGTNLASGVNAAQQKRLAFDTYLVQTVNNGLPTIAAMPNTTLAEAIMKAGAWITYMHDHPYGGQ